MAHAFKIMDSTNAITTYTDYDSIPLATLKHVISFLPDLGTLVDSNEILIELDTFDSGETDNFVTEPTLTSIEVELETATSTGGLLLETGDDVRMEDVIFLEERTFTAGDNLVLNGTDLSSTNTGSNLIMEFADGRHKLVPEDFTDISLATFTKVSPSLSSQDNDVRDVKWNTDGTKMFMLGRANDSVYEYSASTAFDVSTITFVRDLDIGVVDATQGDNAANSIEFNTDGTKMFMLGQGQDLVNEYALSTGFDLSTSSFTRSLDINPQESLPYGLAFNNDGTKMYITGWSGDDINEYTLTTGFDVSTASFSQLFSVSSETAKPSAVQFDSDGSTMYVLGGDTIPKIYQYTLTTEFDISTASYSGISFTITDQETKPRGFCFGDNGTKLYVAGWQGDDINQYTATAGDEVHLVLETADDVSTTGHYHLPVGTPHTDDDGHTAAEHREIDLWNYKLGVLITQENTNAGSD
jgi:sugar lactone lactonase YvrE